MNVGRLVSTSHSQNKSTPCLTLLRGGAAASKAQVRICCQELLSDSVMQRFSCLLTSLLSIAQLGSSQQLVVRLWLVAVDLDLERHDTIVIVIVIVVVSLSVNIVAVVCVVE